MPGLLAETAAASRLLHRTAKRVGIQSPGDCHRLVRQNPDVRTRVGGDLHGRQVPGQDGHADIVHHYDRDGDLAVAPGGLAWEGNLKGDLLAHLRVFRQPGANDEGAIDQRRRRTFWNDPIALDGPIPPLPPSEWHRTIAAINRAATELELEVQMLAWRAVRQAGSIVTLVLTACLTVREKFVGILIADLFRAYAIMPSPFTQILLIVS